MPPAIKNLHDIKRELLDALMTNKESQRVRDMIWDFEGGRNHMCMRQSRRTRWKQWQSFENLGKIFFSSYRSEPSGFQ